MLKNVSVSVKGFAAFGILAFLAIGSNALIYTQSVDAEHSVENNLLVMGVISKAGEVSNIATGVNLAAKNFLLTGNRDFVKDYDDLSARFDTEATKLSGMIAEEASSQAAAARRVAHHLDPAAGQDELPEHRAQQARLARAVGAEHRDELARRDREVDVRPHGAVAEGERRPGELEDGWGHRVTASRIAATMRCIHSTYPTPDGSVSVTGTTGMPADFATASTASVCGPVVCAL